MIILVVKLSHLFLIISGVLHAAPIVRNRSESEQNRNDPKLKAMLTEYHISKLPAALRNSLILPKFQAPKKFNITQIKNELKSFGIHGLKEDHHLEGLPLDRKGKINPDFHKEIFLGNHELFEVDIQHDEAKRNKKLEEIFNKADVDRDTHLSQKELLDHVFQNVQTHLREASQKNTQLFVLIDTNQDGKVTWHEYFALYVTFHNMNSSTFNESNTFDFVQQPFDDDFQRELVKIRYRWTEADASSDNELDIDEFLIFRHPEATGQSYKYVVDDIILQMDRDGDQKLVEGEFAFLPAGVLEDGANKEWIEMDRRWLNEQKKEFHEMDGNKDGALTREELLKAYDPLNRVHIGQQIRRLFEKVDDAPKDDFLTLDEIQKHADVFTDMRLVDTDKALHDEI